MESTESPDDNQCDEVLILKKKLSETEDKLVKFKKFVVNLRNERTQFQDKVSESNVEIEKLRNELSKFQNKSYQQIFQNFQNLQIEYDKIQDELDSLKKINKAQEQDFLNCSLELSHSRESCAIQKNEIENLKIQSLSQQSNINELNNVIKELESKVIVLQTECKSERKKYSDFQECENERSAIKEKLVKKSCQINELTLKLEKSLERVNYLEQENSNQNIQLNKFSDEQKEKDQLKIDNENLSYIIDKQAEQINLCNKKIDELTLKNEKFEKRISDLQLSHSQKVSALELVLTNVENKLKLSEEDLSLCNTKFEEYKQRVSSVLRENKINNLDHDKNIDDLTNKIESLQEENKTLKEKLRDLNNVLEKSRIENNILKDEILMYKNEGSDFNQLKKKFNSLTKENYELINKIEKLQENFSKEKLILEDKLVNIETLKSLNDKNENKIKELEDEIIHLRSLYDDSNSVVNSNISFDEIKEENISFPSSNNSNSERNFLEEILNVDSSTGFSDVQTSSNIDNLTQLLSESENSIMLLSEQNRLLKEEIRRLQRNVDRTEIANNLEYLKNVLMKFLTIKGTDERERLISVMTTILKLTTEERSVFYESIQDSTNSHSNSKWALWQWS